MRTDIKPSSSKSNRPRPLYEPKVISLNQSQSKPFDSKKSKMGDEESDFDLVEFSRIPLSLIPLQKPQSPAPPIKLYDLNRHSLSDIDLFSSIGAEDEMDDSIVSSIFIPQSAYPSFEYTTVSEPVMKNLSKVSPPGKQHCVHPVHPKEFNFDEAAMQNISCHEIKKDIDSGIKDFEQEDRAHVQSSCSVGKIIFDSENIEQFSSQGTTCLPVMKPIRGNYLSLSKSPSKPLDILKHQYTEPNKDYPSSEIVASKSCVLDSTSRQETVNSSDDTRSHNLVPTGSSILGENDDGQSAFDTFNDSTTLADNMSASVNDRRSRAKKKDKIAYILAESYPLQKGNSSHNEMLASEFKHSFQVHRRMLGWKLTSVQRRKELVNMIESVNRLSSSQKQLLQPISLHEDSSPRYSPLSFDRNGMKQRQDEAWQKFVTRSVKARMSYNNPTAIRSLMESKTKQGEMRKNFIRSAKGNTYTNGLVEVDASESHRAGNVILPKIESKFADLFSPPLPASLGEIKPRKNTGLDRKGENISKERLRLLVDVPLFTEEEIGSDGTDYSQFYREKQGDSQEHTSTVYKSTTPSQVEPKPTSSAVEQIFKFPLNVHRYRERMDIIDAVQTRYELQASFPELNTPETYLG